MAERFHDSARLANALLEDETPKKSMTENEVNSNLVKLLPIIVVIMSPIFSNGGHCYNANKYF